MPPPQPLPMAFAPAGPLRGSLCVPGDKSISHRALMLAAMARGCSRIEGLSEGTGVAATAAALGAMGVRIGRSPGGWTIAAAFASGTSRASGLSELRVKESGRIAAMAAMAAGLRAIGASVMESDDGLAIEGSAGRLLAGGATIDPELDHRIAMAFAVAGLRCAEPVTVADMASVGTSFPEFAPRLTGLQTG